MVYDIIAYPKVRAIAHLWIRTAPIRPIIVSACLSTPTAPPEMSWFVQIVGELDNTKVKMNNKAERLIIKLYVLN